MRERMKFVRGKPKNNKTFTKEGKKDLEEEIVFKSHSNLAFCDGFHGM